MKISKDRIVLNRRGSKGVIAKKIIEYFPKFDRLVSLFFGSGAIEFQFLGKIKYLIANDLDSNVFNLYEQIKHNCDALIDCVSMIPYHPCIFTPQADPDPVKKAAFFAAAANYSYLSGGGTLKYGRQNAKKILKRKIKELYLQIVDNPTTTTQFMSAPFDAVFKKIEKRFFPSFIYCDPPYIGVSQATYNTPTFMRHDLERLVQLLLSSKQQFAISEFDSPCVLEIVKKNGLNIINIGNRRNLANRRNEIIITNYIPQQPSPW